MWEKGLKICQLCAKGFLKSVVILVKVSLFVTFAPFIIVYFIAMQAKTGQNG